MGVTAVDRDGTRRQHEANLPQALELIRSQCVEIADQNIGPDAAQLPNAQGRDDRASVFTGTPQNSRKNRATPGVDAGQTTYSRHRNPNLRSTVSFERTGDHREKLRLR
jgi:hypothetical protein